jgi:MFS family permease
MSDPSRASGRHLTLALCTLLHGFTHAYGSLLVPLYLLMVADLHLHGIWQASLIVTISGIVYCLGSYVAGVMADRFDRKWLLGIGLIGNALAILATGLTRQYEMMMFLGVLAGLFGTLFHPCANALAPAQYPKNPGLAIGILGMGSGLGFFVGPQFAGWRAQTAHWHFGTVADWQRPCVEMGLIGIVAGIIFLIFAKEPRKKEDPRTGEKRAVLPNRMSTEEIVMEYEPRVPGLYLNRAMRWRITGIAAILGCRDFAGVASLTLASLYLQKAHGYTVQQAGFTVGAMMLIGVIVNPLSVWISGGARRLPMLSAVLVAGGLVLAVVPWVDVKWVLAVLCVFKMCQLGSYAMSDAAMLERVAPEIRGRVVGLFLTLAGTFAATAPFVMGWWVDVLKDRSHDPTAYRIIFASMAGMMVFSAVSTPLIGKLANEKKVNAPPTPAGALPA